MKLKAIYSSSLHVPTSNNMIIATQQSQERESHYLREVFDTTSPFCPKGYDNIKKKKAVKEGFEIDLTKKTKK